MLNEENSKFLEDSQFAWVAVLLNDYMNILETISEDNEHIVKLDVVHSFFLHEPASPETIDGFYEELWTDEKFGLVGIPVILLEMTGESFNELKKEAFRQLAHNDCNFELHKEE